jgi:hypothetical protein
MSAACAIAWSSPAISSRLSSLALCGVELSSPSAAWVAVRSLACGAAGISSLNTVTHSST